MLRILALLVALNGSDTVNFTRFSGHLQRLDRDSRQEVDDEETRTTRV